MEVDGWKPRWVGGKILPRCQDNNESISLTVTKLLESLTKKTVPLDTKRVGAQLFHWQRGKQKSSSVIRLVSDIYRGGPRTLLITSGGPCCGDFNAFTPMWGNDLV